MDKHLFSNWKSWVSALLAVCMSIALVPVSQAAQESPVPYLLPLEHQGEYTYLDVMQDGTTWLVNGESLCALANCQMEQSGDQVSLSRKSSGLVLYTTTSDQCVVQDDQIFLPLQAATVSTGLCFEQGDPYPSVAVLKVPKEFEAAVDAVLNDERIALGQLQEDLGLAWTTIASTSQLYAINPFVHFSAFVDVLTGESEISAYEEAFARLLSNEGVLYDTLSNASDFDEAASNTQVVLELAQMLIGQNSALSEYAKNQKIQVKDLDELVQKYPEQGYGPGLEKWLKTYTNISTITQMDYILDSCTMYTDAMDAEESVMTALKVTFDHSSNYGAYSACQRILTYRYGTAAEKYSQFYRGWAKEAMYDLLKAGLKKLFEKNFQTIHLAAAAMTSITDFLLGASNIADFTLAYDTYTLIQKELRNYLSILNSSSGPDVSYQKRATTILYIKCAIAAYEGTEFDKSLESTLSNAQSLFTSFLLDILSYSEQEYAPTYDNHEVIDWLNSNAATFDVEQFLTQIGQLYTIDRQDTSRLDASGKYGATLYYDLVTFNKHLSKYEEINRSLREDYQEYQDRLPASELDLYLTTAYSTHDTYQYTIETTLAYQDDDIISFLQTSTWYMGGVANRDYNGYVISLSTGEFLTLPQLLNADKETLLSDLQAIALCLAGSNGQDLEQIQKNISTWKLEDYEYYVKDGQVYLLFDTYTLGPGVSGALQAPLCQVGGIPARIQERGEVKGAASFLGGTVGELKLYYGSVYEIGYWKGGTHIQLSGSPLFYLRGPDIPEDVTYGGHYPSEFINNYLIVYNIEAFDDTVLLEQLTSSMTYPELIQAVGDEVSLSQPDYYENVENGDMDGPLYTLSFTYKGYSFGYQWKKDPNTTRSHLAYVAISHS